MQAHWNQKSISHPGLTHLQCSQALSLVYTTSHPGHCQISQLRVFAVSIALKIWVRLQSSPSWPSSRHSLQKKWLHIAQRMLRESKSSIKNGAAHWGLGQ